MKINKKFLITILFIFGILLIINTKANAANASIKCNSSVTVDTPITISVSGSGVQWNLELKVDGKTIAKSSELDNYESNKNISFSGTYTPTSTGNKKVTLEGTVTEFSDGSTIRSFSSKEITVNAKSNSNDQSGGGNSSGTSNSKATLTKLVVAGKIYNNPSKNITVNVGNDVTSAKIVPTTSNGESFKIDKGNTVKLEEGTNTVKITLASGNIYTVKIIRAAKENNDPNIIDETKEETVELKSLVINGISKKDNVEEKIKLSFTPEFSSQVYEYRILLDENYTDITKLDIEAIATKEDYIVEIKGNNELKYGENIIEIIVKSKDGKSTLTYKIIVTKQEEQVIQTSNEPTLDETNQEQQEEQKTLWNTTQKIFIVVFTSITAILGIIFAVIEYRYGKKKQDMKMGEIPFSKIEFEKEQNNKEENISKERIEQEDNKEKKVRKRIKEEKIEQEKSVNDEKPTKGKGKHF